MSYPNEPSLPLMFYWGLEPDLPLAKGMGDCAGQMLRKFHGKTTDANPWQTWQKHAHLPPPTTMPNSPGKMFPQNYGGSRHAYTGQPCNKNVQ